MKKRVFSVLICLLTVMTLLCGCTVKEDNARLEPACRAMLDALIAGDADAGYAQISEAVTREEFDAFFAQVAPVLDGKGKYELKSSGWHKNTNNGVTSVTVTFEATFPDGRVYLVNCTETEGVEGLTGFHVQDSKQNITNDTPFGLRAVFFVLSALFLAFAVWMIVDCVKRKPDGMVLWIVLMACAVTLSLEIAGGQMNVNWGIGLVLSFSSIAFNSANFLFRFSLPVGAIVYFFLRKRLPSKKNAPQTPNTVEGSFTEPAVERPTEEAPAEETPAEEPKKPDED